MNVNKKNDIEYKLEKFWRNDKYKRDDNNVLYPEPKEGTHWAGQEQFVDRLEIIQQYVIQRNMFKQYEHKKDCRLCDKKNITTGRFQLNRVVWEDGLKHYINVHNVKPTDDFIDFIYKFTLKDNKEIMRIKGNKYTKNDVTYIKLHRNQFMILDALLRHGGYSKRYIEDNKGIYRYSEHAGLLDFNRFGIEKIIVSGNTTRVDRGDDEIYLPRNIPDAFSYEYIFHTHPPTPKPGGRAKDGILYEFPSIGDIFHFIDHYNEGSTTGSLVLTSEGLYNIRSNRVDNKEIKVNEDRMFEEYMSIWRIVQNESIKKYGINFNTYEFYSTISQNLTPINKLNKILNKYDIHIDFYPRVRDSKNNWIIDSIYLPVRITELLKK